MSDADQVPEGGQVPAEASSTETAAGAKAGQKDKKKQRRGVFSRLALFIRQIIAELRKVIWPTRKELVTYTTVVLVFVGLMAAIVALYDLVFTKGVLAVFG